MSSNISIKNSSCCFPCTSICNAGAKVVSYIVSKVDATAACILRNIIYYNPLCQSKGNQIELVSRSIKEVENLSKNDPGLARLNALQNLIWDEGSYINDDTIPQDIDAAIENKIAQLSTALKAHYYTFKGVWQGVHGDQELIGLKSDLSKLYEAKMARNKPVPAPWAYAPVSTLALSTFSQPPIKTESLPDPVTSISVPKPLSEEKIREIELLSQTIKELEALTAKDREIDHLVALNNLIPGYAYSQKFTIPEDAVAAIESKKAQLLTALKTHKLNIEQRKEIDSEKCFSQMKTDLARFYDVKRIRQNPGVRPKNETILPLTPNMTKAEWPKPDKLIAHFPPHIFYFPHAIKGSDETNNFRRNREQTKLLYNINNPWAIALEHAEKVYLPRPLESMSPEDLKQMLKDLHSKLSGQENEPFRDREVIVFRVGEQTTFKEYSRQVQDSDPEISKAAMEMHMLGQRWGALETSEEYYETIHWKAMSKIGYLAPPPEKVDELLNEFFIELKKIMEKGSYHPYQVAAFIHNGLTSIHPYGDINGRLARLFMNVYLMQHGLPPLVVLSDRKYTNTVNSPVDKFEAAFTDYLHNSAEETGKMIAEENLPTVKEPGEWQESGHPLIDCLMQ